MSSIFFMRKVNVSYVAVTMLGAGDAKNILKKERIHEDKEITEV